MSFIYGTDAYYTDKVDVTTLPNPANEKVEAVDMNLIKTYAEEARDAFRAGMGHGFTTQASAPVVSGMSTFLWALTTNSLLKYRFGGTDKNVPFGATTTKGDILVYTGATWEVVPAGANGRVLTANSAQTSGVEWAVAAGTTTLSAAYAAGASQANSTFSLDSTRLGLLVKDAGSTIGTLFSIQNNAGSTNYFTVAANAKSAFKSGMADGGTAIALEVDTTATWSNSGARLLSIKNNTTERFTVMASGDYNTSASNFWWDLANSRLHIGSPASPTGRLHIRGGNGSQSQMRIDNDTNSVSMMVGSADSPAGAFVGSLSAHPLYLRHTNNNIIAMSATDFSPLTTNSVDLGLTGTRWKDLWLAGTLNGTYSIGGTPTLSSNMVFNADQTRSIGSTSSRLANLYTAAVNSGTGSVTLALTSSANVNVTTANISSFNVSAGGSYITQNAQSGTTAQAFKVEAGAHTNQAASTQVSDVYFDLSRTVQWNTGALATQRAFLIDAPTYSFVGSSTITSAATVAIENAPQAGTNATITDAYALWVQAGRIAADGGIKLTGNLTGTYNISGTPTALTPILSNMGATTVAPTWTAVTYQNSWVDFGASATTRYTKSAIGQVTLEIRAKNGATATSVAFTLPVGFRPGQTAQCVGQTLAGGIACGDLGTDGVFSPTVSSTSGIFIRVQYFAEG